MVWPRQSALGSHPCVALSSAAVSLTLLQNSTGQSHLLVGPSQNVCTNDLYQGINTLCSGSTPLAGFEVSTYGRFSDVHRGPRKNFLPSIWNGIRPWQVTSCAVAVRRGG